MERHPEFVDLLCERRKDCDFLWASRSMDPLLPHKLPPEFAYSRKQAIEEVLNDERVKLAITTLGKSKRIDQSIVANEARTMVNEMASKAHLVTVRWIGIVITKVVKRILSSIFVNETTLFQLKKEMQISQVQYVYAPSHRSYMDFILLSYILFSYDMALPNIASGMDFYKMRIVGELLRKTGAFYMRRSFVNDVLYKKVFRAYVMSLVSHSERAIEFFIEGTRSRSLKSIVPKYGLLSIILEGLLEGNVPDVQFVPISISYERPPEELLFAYELLGVPKPKESMTSLFRSLSILQKPRAYGSVFFNIGEPISASRFLSAADRKARVLSPHAKLPSTATEKLAYSIIESHKRNTVLVPFNLIALLFNERIQVCPDHPYRRDSLLQDYLWCANVCGTLVDARTVHTGIKGSDVSDASANDVWQDILHALRPHQELLEFDSADALRLKQRHRATKLGSGTGFKGHALSEETMEIAVSAINITIYLNPVLSFLIKPAIVTVAVGMDGIQLDEAFERYALLRTLLSTEFAMPLKVDGRTMKSEWEETFNLLLKQNVLCLQNGAPVRGQDTKLFSLLYNATLPFIDAIYITCLVLFEWDELAMGVPTTRGILVESQKRAERAFLRGKGCGRHPYTLSLDLFNSTLSNLFARGIVVPHEHVRAYRANKIHLAHLLTRLESLSLKRPPGSYLCVTLLSDAEPIQAKL